MFGILPLQNMLEKRYVLPGCLPSGRPVFASRSIRLFQKGGILLLWYLLVPTSADDWLKKKAVHVLLCLCNNACKRSLAICRKGRALCPVSRRLSVPI